MKKVFIIISLIFIAVMSGCGNNIDMWKDTISSFGEGTYQMIHQNDDGEDTEILANCKYSQCVLTKINSYEKKITMSISQVTTIQKKFFASLIYRQICCHISLKIAMRNLSWCI